MRFGKLGGVSLPMTSQEDRLREWKKLSEIPKRVSHYQGIEEHKSGRWDSALDFYCK